MNPNPFSSCSLAIVPVIVASDSQYHIPCTGPSTLQLFRPPHISLCHHLYREQRTPPGEVQGLLVRTGKRQILRTLRGGNQSKRFTLRAEHLDTGRNAHIHPP